MDIILFHENPVMVLFRCFAMTNDVAMNIFVHELLCIFWVISSICDPSRRITGFKCVDIFKVPDV